MRPSVKNIPPAAAPRTTWVYVSLTVVDGQRRLKPAQVGPDRLLFDDPPHLTSQRVEIILNNGDQEQRNFADILPHDALATTIPIQLLPPHRLR
jgi:hypothetical protein